MKNVHEGTFWQAIATAIIWVMLIAGIALGGVFLAEPLGEDVLGFFFMLLAAAVVCTGFVWDWGRIPGEGRRSRKQSELAEEIFASGQQEKRKRDRLGSALRQLSEEELIRLRDRISSGDIGDEELEEVLRDEI